MIKLKIIVTNFSKEVMKWKGHRKLSKIEVKAEV